MSHTTTVRPAGEGLFSAFCDCGWQMPKATTSKGAAGFSANSHAKKATERDAASAPTGISPLCTPIDDCGDYDGLLSRIEASQNAKLPVGTRVIVLDDPTRKYAGVWVIEKVGPSNYSLKPVDGGRGLRCPHYMVERAPEGAAAAAIPTRRAELDAGTVVRFKKDGKLYVVTKDDGQKINIASLGGSNGGRYWRTTPNGVTVMDQVAILAALAGVTA